MPQPLPWWTPVLKFRSISWIAIAFSTLTGCGGTSPSSTAAPATTTTAIGDRLATAAAFIPAYVPKGMNLCSVETRPKRAPARSTPDPEEQRWIWGDLSLENPWKGPLVEIVDRRGSAEMFSEYYSPDGSETATVRGGPGSLGPLNTWQGVAEPKHGYTATWMVTPGHVAQVRVVHGTAADSLAMAEKVDISGDVPRLPEGTLGRKTGILRTPDDAGYASVTVSGVGYAFRDVLEGDSDANGPDSVPFTADDIPVGDMSVQVIEAGPDLLDEFAADSAEPKALTIRGRPAVLGSWLTSDGPWTVIWQISPTRYVHVGGFLNNLTATQVRRIVGSLRLADRSQLEKLKTRVHHNAGCSPTFG